jgi:myo-inositol-hexaphosphate 3-phosphohydrolase
MTHPTRRLLFSLLVITLLALSWHTVVRGALPTVAAVLETAPKLDDEDADDPAIWVHPKDASSSLVLTTLKEGGLDVYDLSGARVQHVAPDAAPAGQDLNSARYNNVDLIYEFKVGAKKVDLVVVSDRYNDMIRVFAIDPDPGAGYLLVSSQGSNEFLVYDRKTLEHIGNFLVGDGIVDSVEESDGMHVVNVNLSGRSTRSESSTNCLNGAC